MRFSLRTFSVALLACLALLSTWTAASGAILADSVSEFSGTQGQNGWYYGYFDGPFNSSDFVQLPQFIPAGPTFPIPGFGPSHWAIDGDFSNPPWVEIASIGGHPDHVSSGGVTRWAVRRWISDTPGFITIAGNAAHLNSFGGDGTTVHLFIDGVEVYSQILSFGDTVGIDYSTTTLLHVGSMIDLAIDPDGPGSGINNISDHTRFTATIATPASVPEPNTFGLMVGGLGLLAWVLRKSIVG